YPYLKYLINRLFKYHAIFTHFLQRPAPLSLTPESRSSQSAEQRAGLSECRQSGGAFDRQFTQTPLAKHASFGGSLVAEVSLLCISSVCLIAMEFPTTKPRDSELQETTKEVDDGSQENSFKRDYRLLSLRK